MDAASCTRRIGVAPQTSGSYRCPAVRRFASRPDRGPTTHRALPQKAPCRSSIHDGETHSILDDLSAGTSRVLLTHTPFLWGPAVSPDGREVAFSRSEEDGAWHIWTIDLSSGTLRRVTAGEAGEVYPRYSPDGTSLWFHTWIAPRRIGHVLARGGPLEMVPLTGEQVYADLSPDGKTLAFSRADADSERVYLAPAGGGSMRALTRSSGAVPRWSPDGSLIVYAGDRGYAGGILVIKPDGSSERRLTPDGGWPVWWPGGREVG